MKEYIVVGAGITGAVIARHIADLGHKVTVYDRRKTIGGNLYEEKTDNGILVQKYGPHIFHTNSDRVYEYIKKYAKWENYFLECMVYMQGKYTPSPFNFSTIDDYFSKDKALEIKSHIKAVYGDAERATIVDMLECQDEVVRKYAEFLFESDYSLYTAKQWGVSPTEIDISVLKRVPVLFSYNTGYFSDKYQCMPVGGFTKFIANILNHENITVQLDTDALSFIKIENSTLLLNGVKTDKTVFYTGAVDELMKNAFGVLPYRSLRFEYKWYNMESYQEAPVVAYPEADGYTRITEYTKLPIQRGNGKTIIAKEFPLQYEKGISEPYYPIPTDENISLYKKYSAHLACIDNLIICGRLGEYKYYNMDQAIERALELCDSIR